MAGSWTHEGSGGSMIDTVFDAATFGLLGTKECVRNSESGEYRDVYVGPDQSVGEAIANGQFTQK